MTSLNASSTSHPNNAFRVLSSQTLPRFGAAGNGFASVKPLSYEPAAVVDTVTTTAEKQLVGQAAKRQPGLVRALLSLASLTFKKGSNGEALRALMLKYAVPTALGFTFFLGPVGWIIGIPGILVGVACEKLGSRKIKALKEKAAHQSAEDLNGSVKHLLGMSHSWELAGKEGMEKAPNHAQHFIHSFNGFVDSLIEGQKAKIKAAMERFKIKPDSKLSRFTEGVFKTFVSGRNRVTSRFFTKMRPYTRRLPGVLKWPFMILPALFRWFRM